MKDRKIFYKDKVVGNISFFENIYKYSEEFESYFEKQAMEEEDFHNLVRDVPDKVSVIDFIFIDEDYRKLGLAKKTIESIIANAEESVLLLCENPDSFLYSFYSNLGFKEIGKLNNLPIMIHKI